MLLLVRYVCVSLACFSPWWLVGTAHSVGVNIPPNADAFCEYWLHTWGGMFSLVTS